MPPGDDSAITLKRLGSNAEIAEIRRLYARGSVDAALALATKVRAREGIPLTAVPVVTVTPEALLKLPLDHRAGFMLTRIDGVSNVQAVVDISAMPRDEALALLETLETLGALSFVADDDEPTQPKSSMRPTS